MSRNFVIERSKNTPQTIPDLAPSDYHLFPAPTRNMADHKCKQDGDVESDKMADSKGHGLVSMWNANLHPTI